MAGVSDSICLKYHSGFLETHTGLTALKHAELRDGFTPSVVTQFQIFFSLKMKKDENVSVFLLEKHPWYYRLLLNAV